MACVAEFGGCKSVGGSPGCCAPLRCFQQNRYYSQCGTACPSSATIPWDCAKAPPSIAIVIGRWGGWPGWTSVLLRTVEANPTITFLMLSDEAPAIMPPNAHFHHWPLERLRQRFQSALGYRVAPLSANGTFETGVSSAKVNDLKPLFGEAFEHDLLRSFDWWGYLQEDVLLGDMRRMLTPQYLAKSDVICPFDAPLNSSGTLMLFRNTPQANRLWRLSRDASRVLSSRNYLVFVRSARPQPRKYDDPPLAMPAVPVPILIVDRTSGGAPVATTWRWSSVTRPRGERSD